MLISHTLSYMVCFDIAAMQNLNILSQKYTEISS